MNEELGIAIFENAFDAIIVTEAVDGGFVLSANLAACGLFGYTAETFATLPRAAVFDPTDPEVARLLRAGDAPGRAVGEVTFRRADGSRFVGEIRTALVADRRGAPTCVSLIRDISDRRRALIHDMAPVAIVLATMPEGRIVSVNEAFVALCGCTREMILGKTTAELNVSTADGHTQLPAALGDRHFLRDLRVSRKTTRGADLLMSVNLDRVQLGAAEYVVATAHDVTEREHELAAVRASEARHRLFIENAPASIAMLDRDLRYLSASRQWIEDFRLTDDIIGRCHYDVFPEIPEYWKVVHRRGLAGETIRSEGERFDRADGTVQWIKWKVLPWHTATGEIGGVLFSSENITDEKQAEAALKDADQRKDEFLATLAHELRNPLAPLRSGLDVLQLTSDAATRDRTIATMSRQLGNLVRLVDDLLDVSRISRGKVELLRECVPLASVIDSAVETTRPLIDARRHALTIHVPEQPIWVDVDPTRMAQVISNLLHNAAKYATKPGHIELHASEEGDEVVLRVIDDGIGIAAAELPRLFNLFAQVGTGRNHDQGGMGIGLSLVRRLVELHGGTVSAESPGLGHGSTFTIRILRARDARRTPAAPPATAAPQRTTLSQRILVVDDNRDVAETLATLLELRGYETRMAHDGASALAAAAAFHPHLMFVDIGLPDMSGYEVGRGLRADPANRGTILVALTGWGGEEDKRRSAAAGFDLHLTKPVDTATLDSVLAHLAQADAPRA